MRCGRCGNENDAANRFCGMCGASLVATTATEARPARSGGDCVPREVLQRPDKASATSRAGPSRSARRRTRNDRPLPAGFVPTKTSEIRIRAKFQRVRPGPARFEPARLGRAKFGRSEARPSAGPVITGHSFLGLSSPGPAVDHNAAPDALRPSSNVDYLLDDEEEPKRGWGKLVLIVLALALAVGLGYLHFKQAGFDGLIAGDKKPVATKPTSDAPPEPGFGRGRPDRQRLTRRLQQPGAVITERLQPPAAARRPSATSCAGARTVRSVSDRSFASADPPLPLRKPAPAPAQAAPAASQSAPAGSRSCSSGSVATSA